MTAPGPEGPQGRRPNDDFSAAAVGSEAEVVFTLRSFCCDFADVVEGELFAGLAVWGLYYFGQLMICTGVSRVLTREEQAA